MTDMVYTFPITVADTTAVVYQFPHPACPCFVGISSDPKGAMFYNSAFGGSVGEPKNATLSSVTAQIVSACERYRINAQSVTVELIAPALSDQGTVTAAMIPFTRQRFYAAPANSGGTVAVLPLDVYDPPTDESTWLTGTSAYTARAKDGCYQPLKLDSFKFKLTNELAILTSTTTPPPLHASPDLVASFPLFSTESTTTPTSRTYGAMMFRGMAANVALRVRVRQVMEMIVKPGTTYAPLAEPAPPPDETACKMYMEISARMKDGYPASYNDLGKLFEVVKRIGRTVLPYVEPALAALSRVPGPVGLVAQGVKAAKTAAAAAAAAHKASLAAKEAQGRKQQPKKLSIKRRT